MSFEGTSGYIAESARNLGTLPNNMERLKGLSGKSEELRTQEVRLQSLLKEKEGEISVTTKEKLEQDTKLRTTQRESSELGKQISEKRGEVVKNTSSIKVLDTNIARNNKKIKELKESVQGGAVSNTQESTPEDTLVELPEGMGGGEMTPDIQNQINELEAANKKMQTEKASLEAKNKILTLEINSLDEKQKILLTQTIPAIEEQIKSLIARLEGLQTERDTLSKQKGEVAERKVSTDGEAAEIQKDIKEAEVAVLDRQQQAQKAQELTARNMEYQLSERTEATNVLDFMLNDRGVFA